MSTIIKPLKLISFTLLLSALSTTNSSFAQRYELVKIDSIKIDSFEPIQITDYNYETKRFLAFGTGTKTLIEVDENGKKLSEANYLGEGPGHYSRGITELGYFGTQKIVNGPNVYFVYGDNWQYDFRMVYLTGGAFNPLSYIPGAPVVIESGGINKSVKAISHTEFGRYELKPDHFEKAPMLELVGPNDERRKIINYPKNSIYNTSPLYYDSHIPAFSYNRASKRLVMALPLQSKVYYYNTNTWELEKEFSIELTDFKKPKGLPYEDQHKNSLRGFGPSNEKNYIYNLQNSKIIKISSYGEINMITHATGFKERASVDTYPKASKEFKEKGQTIISFWKGDQKLFETNEPFNRVVRAGEMQFLTHVINEEEELDYSLFYIYKLRPVDQ